MPFSPYIVWYLFLAGVGAGAYLVACICGVLDAVRARRLRARPAAAADRDVRRAHAAEERAVRAQGGYLVAPAATALAGLLLLGDLGDASRAWRIVLDPFASIMATGAWLVALFFLVSLIVAACGLCLRRVPGWLLGAGWGIGGLLAVGVMTYAGLLLSSMPAVDFWHTWLLPALFIVSSLSTGLAAVLAVDVVGGRAVRERRDGLWRAAGVLGVVEACVLAAFLVRGALCSPTAAASCALLVGGSLCVPFWAGLVGCGLAVPGVLHVLGGRVPRRAFVIAASAGVLVGGFFVRSCVVNAALLTPILAGSFA